VHKHVTALAIHTFLKIYTLNYGTKDTSVGGKGQFGDTHLIEGLLQME
jgi:hypothetical protein